MNLLETADEAAFRAEVRAWMHENLRGTFEPLRGVNGPGDPAFNASLVKQWEQRLAHGGWVGIGWPHDASPRPLPLGQQLIFHEEYVRAGGPGRLGHIGETLLAPTLLAYGTAAQRQRFLPGIRAGTEYWAQGYSEPGAGSDLAAVSTRAALDTGQGAWVLQGQKVWTSWAQDADWIFVLARTDAQSQRHAGLTLLLVPLRQSGIRIRPIRQMTGAAEFYEVFLEGARTDAHLHLGAIGDGWKVAMALLAFERGASTLGQQAQFQQELDMIISLARSNGAAQDPVLRQRIARAALGLQTLRFNALRVLSGEAGLPQGQPPSRAAFILKYAWSNWHRDLGRLAMDVLGPSGAFDSEDVKVQRLQHLWLSSRADTIYAGTNEIQLNLIAERALGMPR